MKTHAILFLVATAALLNASGKARAADAGGQFQFMPCLQTCAPSTAAFPGVASPPNYSFSDGYPDHSVEFRFTVDADGRAKDVFVLQRAAPNQFVERVRAAIQDFKFKPGTLEGDAVPQGKSSVTILITPGKRPSARDEIVKPYKAAMTDTASGDIEGATAKFDEIMRVTNPNVFERGFIARLGAYLALHNGEFSKARLLLDVPTTFGQFDRDTDAILLKFRIAADLGMGDLSDALIQANFLRLNKAADSNDPIFKIVEDTVSKFDASASFPVTVTLPATDAAEGLDFPLHRRRIALQSISGKVDQVILTCAQKTIEYQPSDMIQVPPDWSQCRLFLRGSSGTTLQIVQSKD